MKKRNILVLTVVAVIGFLAVSFLIAGVATKNWLEVEGNTNELQKKFDQLIDPNGLFVSSLAAALPPNIPKQIIVVIVNATLVQVEKQLSANLLPTTYSLFDKQVNSTTKKVPEFQLPQGLIIAGLILLFVGTLLAVIMMILRLGRVRFLRATPLVFLLLGSILILLGYLLLVKIVVEDFGHELGIKSQLGPSLVLAVLSSIIGFVIAVVYGSTMVLYRDHSPSYDRAQTTTTVDQVTLNNRVAPMVMLAPTNKKMNANEQNENL